MANNAVTNGFMARSVYGAAPGMTLGQVASGASMGGAKPPMASMGQSVQAQAAMAGAQQPQSGGAMQEAAMIGISGKPITWWLFLFLLMIGLMWGAKHVGSEEHTFGNIQLSVFNILIISFASILGITFYKTLFTRFPIPGLTALVNAV